MGNTATELGCLGHALTNSPPSLIAKEGVTIADGYAEPKSAKTLIADAK